MKMVALTPKSYTCGAFILIILCLTLQLSEQEIEVVLDKTMVLFRYLQEKVYITFGTRFLAQTRQCS